MVQFVTVRSGRIILMTNERTKRLVANISMQRIHRYHADLAEYYAGDEGRFTRMVTDGGKQLPSASPQGWCNHISNLSVECVDYLATALRTIFARLQAWGLSIDNSILNEVQR